MSSKRINKNAYYFFVAFLYIVVFIPLFTKRMDILNNWDELIAALAIPVGVLNFAKKKSVIISKKFVKWSYAPWITFAIIIALIGNLIFRYQPFLKAVLPDLYITIKFWLAIYVGINIFGGFEFTKYGKRFSYHIKAILIVFAVLFILDKVFNIFPGDIRYGYKSTWLFYEIHSYFASICAFLVCLLTMIKAKVKNYWTYVIVLLLFMISTLRSKAIGAVVLFGLMFYLIYKFKKKFDLKSMVIIGVPILLVGFSQIQVYFFSTEVRAREKLLSTSLKIFKDYFPFGTGFSTYASHYSGVVYSPLYSMYGLDNVYGLAKERPAFISDSFWPMIIAQFGAIGGICFIMALFKLFKNIQLLRCVDIDKYFAANYAFMYLCVSSMSESAFVHTMSVPFGIVIGICLAQIINQNEVKII